MAVVSQSIPNFLNGISQQTPTQRGINQGTEQINLQNDIVNGLSKRPPLEYIATLDGTNVYPNKSKIWNIQRDENNKYICVLYNGGIKVFDLAGVEKTVSFPDGTSYLVSTNPKEDFKLVNIADYTFIANKSIVPEDHASSSAAKVEEFYINFLVTNFGREYQIKLTHPDLAYGINAVLQMPDGSDADNDTDFRDTGKLIDIFLKGTSSAYWNASSSMVFNLNRADTGASLSTSQGLGTYSAVTAEFTFTQYNSSLYCAVVDGNAAYTVSTVDGGGNNEMYSIRDEIADFTKLPYFGKTGTKIKVTGKVDDTASDYWVEYSGNGVWTECIAPSTNRGLDDTKMPHALINNNDGTFTFRQQTYVERGAGDEDTNPDPTFVDRAIQNLTFYKNRLGILSGENLILSGNADYFNFFGTTVVQVLDTDPIDIAASGNRVNTLKNSISFNETLLLFSDTAQYKLASSGEAISPTTAVLNEVSTFSHDDGVQPVSSGQYAYFAQRRNDNTAIREYYSDNDTLTNDGLDITVAVQKLLPTNAYQMISNSTEDVLMVLCADTADSQSAPYATGSNVTATNADTIYLYKYFFDKGEKVQTAWSKWTFTGVKILGGMTDRSYVYLFVAEGKTTKLFKIDLQNLDDATIGFNVHLDLRKTVTGTYSSGTGLTTLTSPYGYKTGLIAVDASTGANYALTSSSSATCTITVADYANIAVGTALTLKFHDGTTITLQSEAISGSAPSSPSGNTHYFRPNESNDTTADNIYTALNAVSGFTVANPAANVVTVTRDAAGDSNLTVTSADTTRLAVTDFVAGDNFTLVGNHTNLIIGVPYESKYTLSPQYVRENTGRGLMAVTSGRYQIRTISFDYENTGFFTVEVTPENRDMYTTVMNGYVIGFSGSVDNPAISSGTLVVPVQSKNTQFVLDIKSSSHLPMFIPSAEVEGFYHRRSKRI